MMDYAMFSPRGNELVHGVVQTAQRESWDWDKTQRHLLLLTRAHPRSAAEAMDTAVREEVYAQLGYSSSFYT